MPVACGAVGIAGGALRVVVPVAPLVLLPGGRGALADSALDGGLIVAGNPEEAARILRCARLFARSEDAAQRLSELCNEAGSDATWRENIVEELQDREDLQAAEAAMEARRQAQLVAQADSVDTALQTLMDEVAADTFGSLDEGYAAQAQAEAVKAWQGRQ